MDPYFELAIHGLSAQSMDSYFELAIHGLSAQSRIEHAQNMDGAIHGLPPYPRNKWTKCSKYRLWQSMDCPHSKD